MTASTGTESPPLDVDPSAQPLLDYDIERQALLPEDEQENDREDRGDREGRDREIEEDSDNGAVATVIQEKESPVKKRATAYLDGLRGVAALGVFTQHLMGGTKSNHGFGENGNYILITFPFIRVFWSGGAAAVAIFFVLSGFVLSQTSVKLDHRGQQRESKRSLISAAIRRPIRLYLPCFTIGLLIALAKYLPWDIYPELGYSPRRENIGVELAHWLDTTLKYFNPFQRHGWKYGVYEYVLILWTIPIELKGSYIIYILSAVGCFGMVSAEWAVFVMLSTAVIIIHFGLWTFGCFIGGLVLTLNHLYQLDDKWVFRRFPPVVKTVAAHVLLFAGWWLLSEPAPDGHPEWSSDTPGWRYLTSLIPESYDQDSFYRFWHSYGAMLFVWGSLHLPWLQAVLNTWPLQYLGRVSFMLYAIHLPLMMAFGNRMSRIFGNVPYGAEPVWWDNMLYVPKAGPLGLNLQWDFIWAVQLAFTLAMAELATRLIDDPSVRLGKWLVRKIGLE
ncbi:hypothetical protein DV738_g113, partial [Chaetothyriales sp. CBS 135597]